MTTIGTSRFQFTTPARSEQVWSALTRPELTARYLFGMALQSDWQAGSPVVVAPPVGSGIEGSLVGEVLAVEAGRRLSYTLSSGPAGPTTFVTWEIEPADGGAGDGAQCGGSTVRLYVDETTCPDGDTEETWLPAVSALRTTLARLLR